MNPADVAQAAPIVHDFSLWSLFWQAHFVVKLVMLGLLAASVWCWAIIVDKTLLFARAKRAMDRFEEVFWSGQSLEELYRTISDRPTTGLAAVFVAAMREWKRSFEGSGRSVASLSQRIDKVLDVTIQREVERLDARLLVLASVGSAGPYIGLFGTVMGHHELLHLHRRLEEHEPCGRRARHRRGAVRDRDRPLRGHPGGDRLQQAAVRRSRSSRPGSRASPTSSRRSCRARSTSASSRAA